MSPTHKVTQSQRSNCPVLELPPDKFWIARHSARNSDLHLKCSSAYSPGPAKQQASCLAFANSFDTQGPPTGCDSPSSVASGRNRENSAPLRVPHLDQTLAPTNWPKTCLVIDSVK